MNRKLQLTTEALEAAKRLIHESIMQFPRGTDTSKNYEQSLAALADFKEPEPAIDTEFELNALKEMVAASQKIMGYEDDNDILTNVTRYYNYTTREIKNLEEGNARLVAYAEKLQEQISVEAVMKLGTEAVTNIVKKSKEPAIDGGKDTQPDSVTISREFTQDEPKEGGSYWMWDGDEESAPIHVEVMWSGFSNRCFVPMGQWGWTRAQEMDELEGYWWAPLTPPSLPSK